LEQEELHKRIRSLLRRHHLLSIATVSERGPWCASCFYAWDEENNTLVITSDPVTRHGAEFRSNPCVAGTIALETKRVGRIRGAQFTGTISEPEGDALAGKKTVIQYKKPNNQRGILFPVPYSISSAATKLSLIPLIWSNPFDLPPVSKTNRPSTTKSPSSAYSTT